MRGNPGGQRKWPARSSWIRAFNQAHPHDQVRVFGVQPPHAEPSDYDAVLDYIRRAAPERLDAMASRLDPIRTAHQMDEHVQRHHGVHPGQPFAAQARDALALLEELPANPERDIARTHARLILDFHERSVTGQGSFAADEQAAADTIIDWHRRTGARIAYWDGIAHTAAVAFVLGRAESEFRSLGSYLRAEFGPSYASVAIGFHHGELGPAPASAPDPAPDLVDALLGTVSLPAHYVDLHSPAPESVRAWYGAPASARVIGGVYDAAKDDDARLTVPSLADAFDVLLHIRRTTPVHRLPEAAV